MLFFPPKYFSLKFSLYSAFSSHLVFPGLDFGEKVKLILSMLFLSFHDKIYFLENFFLFVFGVFLALFLFTWDAFFLWTVFPPSQLYLFLSCCFSLLWLSISFPCQYVCFSDSAASLGYDFYQPLVLRGMIYNGWLLWDYCFNALRMHQGLWQT